MDSSHGIFDQPTEFKDKFLHKFHNHIYLERERLNTFINWPLKSPSAALLAKQGFFYERRADRVTCAFCDIKIEDWLPNDEPRVKHSLINGTCPFLADKITRNVPLEFGNTVAALHMTYCDCYLCESEFSRGFKVDARNPIPFLQVYKKESVFSPNETQQNRVKSYATWPFGVKQDIEKLASAGFLYTKFADQVWCSICKLVLRNWSDDDDPMMEHAKYSPVCKYVYNNMEYIRIVEAHQVFRNQIKEYIKKEIEDPSYTGYYSIPSPIRPKLCVSVTDSQLDHLMQLDLIIEALKCGYHDIEIRAILKRRLLSLGMPYHTLERCTVEAEIERIKWKFQHRKFPRTLAERLRTKFSPPSSTGRSSSSKPSSSRLASVPQSCSGPLDSKHPFAPSADLHDPVPFRNSSFYMMYPVIVTFLHLCERQKNEYSYIPAVDIFSPVEEASVFSENDSFTTQLNDSSYEYQTGIPDDMETLAAEFILAQATYSDLAPYFSDIQIMELAAFPYKYMDALKEFGSSFSNIRSIWMIPDFRMSFTPSFSDNSSNLSLVSEKENLMQKFDDLDCPNGSCVNMKKINDLKKEIQKNTIKNCLVCFDREATQIYLPCKHMKICERCTLKSRSNKCPVCRCVIVHNMKVNIN